MASMREIVNAGTVDITDEQFAYFFKTEKAADRGQRMVMRLVEDIDRMRCNCDAEVYSRLLAIFDALNDR